MIAPLGLESKVVRVVAYDPRWPACFREELQRLTAAVDAADLPPLRFEHVGSTAVPGLAAKPVLDVAAGRDPGAPPALYVSALEAAGYVHRGESGLPGREFFRRGAIRTHHVHLVELGGEHWRRYLRFRDMLRVHPELRDQYDSLKRELARRYPRDREAYIDAKSGFVELVLARAERQRDLVNDSPEQPRTT